VNIRLGIDAVTAGAAAGGGDQAGRFVIADGLGGDARCTRRLADIHGRVPKARMTAIKIPVRGKVKPDHSIKKR